MIRLTEEQRVEMAVLRQSLSRQFRGKAVELQRRVLERVEALMLRGNELEAALAERVTANARLRAQLELMSRERA